MNWFLICNLIYFVLSSFGWPSGFMPDIVVCLFGNLIYIIYFILNKIHFKLNKTVSTIFIVFCCFAIYNIFLGAYTLSLKYIPALLLCLTTPYLKSVLLRYITKWYGVLISISIILYVVLLFVDLPSLGIISHYTYDPYQNYLIYIKPIKLLENFRFNAFYFEPGHCAMVSSMILFANRYSLKSNVWLYPTLISVLLSLSLAGYVLLLIGLILQNLSKVKVLIGFALMVLCVYVFVAYVWEDGENPVNELIVARLEYDEEGGIKGNNRAYMDTDNYIQKSIENGDIWCGVGLTKFNELFNHSIAGSGYKIFLLQYGILGVIMVGLTFYSYSLTATRNNRHFANLFLIFIGLAFLQRCYTFWFSWQMPFICSIAIDSINNKKHRCKQICKTNKESCVNNSHA